MSTPALLAYVDELLSPDVDVPSQTLPPVDRDPPPLPKQAPAIGPIAPSPIPSTIHTPAQMAQAIADKVAIATAATTAPTGRWLRMTVDSDHYAVAHALAIGE